MIAPFSITIRRSVSASIGLLWVTTMNVLLSRKPDIFRINNFHGEDPSRWLARHKLKVGSDNTDRVKANCFCPPDNSCPFSEITKDNPFGNFWITEEKPVTSIACTMWSSLMDSSPKVRLSRMLPENIRFLPEIWYWFSQIRLVNCGGIKRSIRYSSRSRKNPRNKLQKCWFPDPTEPTTQLSHQLLWLGFLHSRQGLNALWLKRQVLNFDGPDKLFYWDVLPTALFIGDKTEGLIEFFVCNFCNA